MSIVIDKSTYFSEWLEEELDKRGWAQTELARRSGLARQTINTLIKGRSAPTAPTAIAIARGFDIAPETALKAADLLPEEPASIKDPSLSELMDMMKRMTPEQRQEILEYVRWQFRRARRK